MEGDLFGPMFSASVDYKAASSTVESMTLKSYSPSSFEFSAAPSCAALRIYAMSAEASWIEGSLYNA